MGLNNIKTEEEIDFDWLRDRLWDDDKKSLLFLKEITLPDIKDILQKYQSKDTASMNENKSKLINNFSEHIDAIKQISTRMGIQGISKNVENSYLLNSIKNALEIGFLIRKSEGKITPNCINYLQEIAKIFRK